MSDQRNGELTERAGWYLATRHDDRDVPYFVCGEVTPSGGVRNQVGGTFRGPPATSKDAAYRAALKRCRLRGEAIRSRFERDLAAEMAELEMLEGLDLLGLRTFVVHGPADPDLAPYP